MSKKKKNRKEIRDRIEKLIKENTSVDNICDIIGCKKDAVSYARKNIKKSFLGKLLLRHVTSEIQKYILEEIVKYKSLDNYPTKMAEKINKHFKKKEKIHRTTISRFYKKINLNLKSLDDDTIKNLENMSKEIDN